MISRLKTPTKRKTSKKKAVRKSRGGSLNSKNPNPYEIAYKKLWDQLPPWQKSAFAEDIANKQFDPYGMYSAFCLRVVEEAEKND